MPDLASVTAASALIFNQNLTGNIIGDVTAQRWINPQFNAGMEYLKKCPHRFGDVNRGKPWAECL